jgi:hypothetical protein
MVATQGFPFVCFPLSSLIRWSFERLLRKLWSYPNRPAIVILNTFSWTWEPLWRSESPPAPTPTHPHTHTFPPLRCQASQNGEALTLPIRRGVLALGTLGSPLGARAWQVLTPPFARFCPICPFCLRLLSQHHPPPRTCEPGPSGTASTGTCLSPSLSPSCPVLVASIQPEL